jgi:hypothetical protein
MTGILGNKWSSEEFNPMEKIPTAVYLTAYSGGPDDFMHNPLNDLVHQIADGMLRVQLGKVLSLMTLLKLINWWRRTRMVGSCGCKLVCAQYSRVHPRYSLLHSRTIEHQLVSHLIRTLQYQDKCLSIFV